VTQIGLYTATENELGAVQTAAEQLTGIDLVVRSESDLDGQRDVASFVDELGDAAAVVLWLHGGRDSMPAYEFAVDELRDAGVPLVVKATGDAFAPEDTTVAPADREAVSKYLEYGGTVNIANGMRFLAREYGDGEVADAIDDPI
jgi:cobaltochelatase CobN